jgi:hypothetical protein
MAPPVILGGNISADNVEAQELDTREAEIIKHEIRRLIEPVVRRARGPSLPIKERRTLQRTVDIPLARQLARVCRATDRGDGAELVSEVLLEEDVVVPKSQRYVGLHIESLDIY